MDSVGDKSDVYENATTKVLLNGRESNVFSDRVGYIRDLFSLHYCSSLCGRRCLESSGKVCLSNGFMQMISF